MAGGVFLSLSHRCSGLESPCRVGCPRVTQLASRLLLASSGRSRDCSPRSQGWCRASRTTSRSPRPWRAAAWPTSSSGRAGAPSGRAGSCRRLSRSTTAASRTSCVRPASPQVCGGGWGARARAARDSGPQGAQRHHGRGHRLGRETQRHGALWSPGPGCQAVQPTAASPPSAVPSLSGSPVPHRGR